MRSRQTITSKGCEDPVQGDLNLMIKQLDASPITYEQLQTEVKEIYSGILKLEAKCIEINNNLASQPRALYLRNEQWQALIHLHRTLLHEHYDFLLATQHPSSTTLRSQAVELLMPDRILFYGVYPYLELLRHQLPDSLEHMLAFFNFAYSIMALLYETVPAFKDNWAMCLGDLSRYCMEVVVQDNVKELWGTTARSWYGKAADRQPTIGRLYFHIAISTTQNILQQLFFYSKSMTVDPPFLPARKFISSFLDTLVTNCQVDLPVDLSFVHLHGVWFTHKFDQFADKLDHYLTLLRKYIRVSGQDRIVQGCFIAVCNIAALYEYNSGTSNLRQAWKKGTVRTTETKEEVTLPQIKNNNASLTKTKNKYNIIPLPHEASSDPASLTIPLGKPQVGNKSPVAVIEQKASDERSLQYAITMNFKILELILELTEDELTDNSNVLPHVHIYMIFLLHLTKSIPAMRLIEQGFPIKPLVFLLNSLSKASTLRFETLDFPSLGHLLPEDWVLRGLEYTMNYFPDGWFEDAKMDDEERLLELTSFSATRKQRILWLGYMIVQVSVLIIQ